ncbi:MAG: heavy metal-associated domain-containing protein [Eubacteriales bacterium]
MTILKVADMHCEKCVERITNALTEANIKFTVSLADKTVSVADDKVATAIEELDDLGFDAVK